MNRTDTLLISCGTESNRKLLRGILGETYNLLEAANTRQTLLLLAQNRSCIAAVVLDISVADMAEIELLTREDTLDLLAGVPVIVITAREDSRTVEQAFALGAFDVVPITYPAYAMVRRIETIVELNRHKENLETLVHEQAQALRHSNDMMVDALSSIIEYRSVESGQHILRIRRYTRILLEKIAENCPEYGLTEEIISIISSAAALHDVGKIGIPDAVLTKTGPLTEAERELMKTHTTIGCRILESMSHLGNQEYLRYAHNICHYHHERWNGGGYPAGLVGEEIPICAQVVGLADVYDALTTCRVYKEAYGFDTSANMILNGECGQFSPKLLECFKQILPRLEEVARDYADGLSPKTETFDVTLPEPELPGGADSLDIVQGKYLCLLHYINAFVLELSPDQGFFHLCYNPYPELGLIHSAGSFQELESIILDTLVAPEDRQRMQDLIHTGIAGYLKTGMRRQSFRFSLCRAEGGYGPYDLTLLRANGNQAGAQTLVVLCRKVNRDTVSETGEGDPVFSSEMVGSTFCCRNDRELTLIRTAEGVHTIAGCSISMIRDQFGGKLMGLIHPEDRDGVRAALREQLNRGPDVQTEFRVLRQVGDPVWVMFEGRLVVEPDGQECLYSYMTDISGTRRAYDTLTEQLARYEVILAQTENTLFDWNVEEDTITFSNTWKHIFGMDPISKNVLRSLTEGTLLHPDDLPRLLDRIRLLKSGSSYEMLEVRITAAWGRYIWCRIRASALRDEDGTLKRIVGVIINIDAEKQAEQALQARAEQDALTKLLNKDAARKQAEEYLNHFPQGVSSALLIIDLDNFKQVNDQFGHLFGDTVLTKVSREIRKLFRAQDIMARIGGDEFMVLIRGISDRTLVENRCQRLLAVFRSEFRDIRNTVNFSCSIGIALSPDHGTTYVELFRRADVALYRAKDQGRNTYVFFDGNDTAFLPRNIRGTAVSNRIDSDEQPGLADNGLVQYAFRQLYTSRDVDASIGQLLALIGGQTNVSRVYVFENSEDNRFCSNTYEWCNTGIAPQLDNLQNVSYETDIPGYDRNFNENDIFYCSDINELPRNLYDILAPQGIKSILHCAIRDKGIFRGYIGFDDCVTHRPWTREQVELLSYFSEMLSVFLLKMRSQEKTRRHARELQNILDSQQVWIHIVDPETYELKYLNSRTRQYAPEARPGMLCYRALMGREMPCPDCPLKSPEGSGHILTRHPGWPGLSLMESAAVQWEGVPASMVTIRKIPEAETEIISGH